MIAVIYGVAKILKKLKVGYFPSSAATQSASGAIRSIQQNLYVYSLAASPMSHIVGRQQLLDE
jgi:hypothetical protein